MRTSFSLLLFALVFLLNEPFVIAQEAEVPPTKTTVPAREKTSGQDFDGGVSEKNQREVSCSKDAACSTDEEKTSEKSTPATTRTPPNTLPERAQDSRHLDLEELYSADRPEEGLRQTESRLLKAPDDAELHLLLARFLYEIGERKKRDDDFDKVALYEKMVFHMERAQELLPGDPRVGWGLGLGLARLATTKGLFTSLKSATRIEQLWLAAAHKKATYVSLKAEEELPCDAYLSLGIFYRMLPNWWLMKLLAGTRGDIDKSLGWLEKANTCSPQKIRVVKELGVAQLCAAARKDDDALQKKGTQTLREMLSLPAVHHTEVIDLRHAKMLLEDPKKACAYSRDGQLKLDDKDLPTTK